MWFDERLRASPPARFRAFLAVMFVYMLHSLREYFNGRHVYRMSIDRMIGVDQAMSDPNSFGASIPLMRFAVCHSVPD